MKVKIKFVALQNIKAHRRLEVYLHSFLTSSADICKQSALKPGHCNIVKKSCFLLGREDMLAVSGFEHLTSQDVAADVTMF
jgi:hypothetical protein